MLADVSDAYDKTEGSFIYDSLAVPAIQFEKTDQAIDEVKAKIDIVNLSGDELAVRINERTGITRKPATKASGQVSVIGNGLISIGDLFETADGVQFSAIETKSVITSGNVNVESVIAGATGNIPANQITLMPVTLPGITSVNNTSPIIDGFDAESDADLLQRYYDRVRTPATSGNKNQYKNWAKGAEGVGDARVISLWAGSNTVKVVIINSDRQPASAQLVQDVQNYIDPNINGDGEGAAPIGAITTVVSATGLTINISATIVLSVGYTLQQATDNIRTSITTYLKNLAFVESEVSYAKVGSLILSSNGVKDYSAFTVNGGTTNIAIGNEQVAIVGDVTVSV